MQQTLLSNKSSKEKYLSIMAPNCCKQTINTQLDLLHIALPDAIDHKQLSSLKTYDDSLIIPDQRVSLKKHHLIVLFLINRKFSKNLRILALQGNHLPKLI